MTVLKECAFDAFQVEVFDCLLKPLGSACFHQTMDRVLRSLEQRTAEDVVSAFAAENQLVLGELVAEEKSNEITALPGSA